MNLVWITTATDIDWNTLAELYKLAPLGDKRPADLQTVFANSAFKYFVFDGQKLVGAGRALADGVDCAYLCDIAIHPQYQGKGLGKAIVHKLLEACRGHKKIILYAAVGKETFYQSLGFKPMRTAMAIFLAQEQAIASGLLAET